MVTKRTKNRENRIPLLGARYHGNRTPETEDDRQKNVQEIHTNILRYATYFCKRGVLNSLNMALSGPWPLAYIAIHNMQWLGTWLSTHSPGGAAV